LASAKGREKAPAKELGAHPEDQKPVTLHDGRYGPYVEHHKLRATLPKDTDKDAVTLEQAVELLKAKAGKGGTAKKAPAKKATTAKKTTTAKATTAKKPAAAKKAPAKKAAAASDDETAPWDEPAEAAKPAARKTTPAKKPAARKTASTATKTTTKKTAAPKAASDE
jgi:DNA topoisomerase-1